MRFTHWCKFQIIFAAWNVKIVFDWSQLGVGLLVSYEWLNHKIKLTKVRIILEITCFINIISHTFFLLLVDIEPTNKRHLSFNLQQNIIWSCCDSGSVGLVWHRYHLKKFWLFLIHFYYAFSISDFWWATALKYVQQKIRFRVYIINLLLYHHCLDVLRQHCDFMRLDEGHLKGAVLVEKANVERNRLFSEFSS